MGTELQTLNDEMNNLVAAFDSDDTEALMKASGQSDMDDGPKMGLPRLTINYQEETDDGESLTRGDWRIWNGTAVAYSPKVYIRPLMRTYEWSIWDNEERQFVCKSVQRTSLGGEFPDTAGGNKCGRLSKQEEESLGVDDPRVLVSRSVNCNQILYGVLDAPDASVADGTSTPIENLPFVAYFKRSGFIPVRQFIEEHLNRKKILMQKAVIELTTQKQKKGSVNFWVPKLAFVKEVSVTDDDKELMQNFANTIKNHNDSVMEQYRLSQKSMLDDASSDLSKRFGT